MVATTQQTGNNDLAGIGGPPYLPGREQLVIKPRQPGVYVAETRVIWDSRGF